MINLLVGFFAGCLTVGLPAYLEHRRSMQAMRDILDVPRVPVIEPEVIPNPYGWRDK